MTDQIDRDDPIDRIAPALRPPAHRVSPRAVRLWTLVAALHMLVLLGAPQGAWWIADGGRSPGHLPVALASATVGIGYLVGMPRWRYRVHRWEITPSAIYTQSGWLHQERRIAPASRVQTVDLRRGPLEQAFGLASVRVTTASAAGPLTIAGLDLAVATALVDELAATAEAAQDDAT